MSSILKALKQIERRKTEIRLPSWPYRTGSHGPQDKQMNRARWQHMILGILILLCSVALVGKLYFGRQPAPDPTLQESSLSPSSAFPVKSAEEKPAGDSRPQSTKAPATPSRKELPVSELSRPPIDPAPAEPLKMAVAEVSETVPTTNPGLSLQALVWSEQPEDRFAVINGKIVREGSTVDGSSIIRIETDHVVIRSDGTSWKLK